LDLSKRRLQVRRRADRFNVIGPLKSRAAYRSIPLTPEVEIALREWRVACPRQGGRLVLVFPNRDGGVESHTPLLRSLHGVQERAGIVTPRLGEDGLPVMKNGRPVMIAKFGIHDLRHFFASWLINELRLTAKKVQVLLGHSSIKTTLDIYGHLFDDHEGDDAAFAAGADRIMSGR
jgi:integrase